MTPANLSRLESLAREATPGEWTAAREANTYWTVMIRGDTPLVRYANECDAAYIAAANPAAVLALIARVRELEGRLEAMLPRRDRIVWPLPNDPDPYDPSAGRGLQPTDRDDT